MKLVRLKLLSEFRGLPKNFEIKFESNMIDPKNINPICLIGLNGSGKSNLLEVISEIFFYLENFSKAKKSEIKNFVEEFGFEIEYNISKNIFNENKSDDYEEAKEYQLKVFIQKKPESSPIAKAWDDELKYEYQNEDPSVFKSYLPNQVIAYSSGMNELISNPFIKMDFQYLEEFEKLKKGIGVLDNRLMFFDYDLNKLITVCNFLFDGIFKNKELGIKNLIPLKRELKIKRLYSFSISLKLREEKNKYIELPSFLNLAIEDLKKCATVFEEKDGNYEFFFYINDATKKLFKEYFKTSKNLFDIFYFFRLLNNRLISKDTRAEIKKADEKVNISALIPTFEENQKIFNISNIGFIKKHVSKPVYYKQLSDGEHQFLHVFGMLLLMDGLGTLFLMDEPETHFNPDWRSKFASTLNELLFDEEIYAEVFREQELVLTTHSPFIVSDCKKENVYKFQRDEKTNKILPLEKPKFETLGASVNKITMQFFGKKDTISSFVIDKLRKIKNDIDNKKIDLEEAQELLDQFGESIEKMAMDEYIKRVSK